MVERYYLYIVLTRTNTVISKLIQAFKNDEYTHAAISLDKDLNYMYSFSRKHTYNPFIGRFRNEDINKGVYRFCKTLLGVIIELEVSKQQYEKAKVLVEHFISNSNLYKYNYKGLLHSLFNKPVLYHDRFLCSEFVYHILKESGIADLRISRNLVRPQSLLNIEGKIIYKGNLKEIKLQSNNWNTKETKARRLSTIYE
jgi:hypothetical protein